MVSYVAGAFSASMFLSVLFRAITPCGAHNPEGFISIDCGSPRTDYLDPSTNLTWTGDGSHMLTGKNGVIPITTAVPSFFPNREALKDFRYFPPGRNKHCYELPLTGNSTTFLIRAMFFHSSSSVLSQRTRFQIYVNATKWVNVQYGVDGDDDFRLSYPEIREGIFYKYPGAYTENVCLVPEFGIPFISSLELRELDHEGMMYSDNMVDTWSRQRLFLTKLWRRNLVPYDLWGNESTHLDNWASILRYPDDHFDRIWDPMPIRDNNSERVSNPNVSQVRLKLLNNLPPKTVESGEYLTALWNGFGNFYPDRISGGTVCFIFYFHSNQSSQKSPTIVRFSAGDQNMEWNDTNELSMTSIASFQRGGSQSIAIAGTYNSSLDLLAYEGYYADQYTMDRTALPDLEFVNFMKRNFNMSDWQGDPCLPTPYNFIECSSDIYLSPSYSWLTSLTLFNLSKIKDIMQYKPNHQQTVSSLPLLSSLSITHNAVDDNPMQHLLTNVTSRAALKSLNLSYNNITAFWNTSIWGKPGSSTSWGNAWFFLLSILDLSYNQITSVPHLEVLNGLFYNNQITSLQELNVSNNQMLGDFLFSPFLSASTSFKALNADHNALTWLNLTDWHEALTRAFRSSAAGNKSDPIFSQLFSFAYNNISLTIPSVEDLESNLNASLLIHYFNNNSGGVMEVQYRSSHYANDFVQTLVYQAENHEDNNTRLLKWLIPASVLGGFVIFGLSAGTIFLYRRLKRQEMENLRQKRMLEQMQKKQAELERKFRPLIFLYDELKRATNEFSKELGRGGFGIVYEGILQHGTKVAVKVLNNKVLEEDEKQLEKDFVTEVSNVCGISHTNVAQLLGYCYNDRKRIIIYELVEGGDLAQALWGHKNQNTTLQWKERLRICAGVAKGLAYLHEGLNSPGVIHRDIKPSNILLGRNLNPKIADFGLAQATWEMGPAAPVTHLRGTLPYAAREYVERRILTEKYDVYSFGVVALEIISGRKCEDPNQDDPAKFFLKKWAQTLQNKGNLVGLLPSELKETSPLDQVESVIKIALSCLEEDDYTRRPKMSKVQCMLEDLMPPDVPSGSAHKKMPMGRAGGTADENSTASQRTWTHSPDVPSGSSSALELLPMGRAGGTAADKNSTPSPRTGIPSSPRFEFPFSSGRSDAVVKGTEEEGLLTSFSGVEISLASGGTA